MMELAHLEPIHLVQKAQRHEGDMQCASDRQTIVLFTNGAWSIYNERESFYTEDLRTAIKLTMESITANRGGK